MSAQHTPGPWSVTDNSWEISTVYGPDGETVASCPINSVVTEDTQFEHEAVMEANARLVSAAPELFEALRAAIKHVDPLQCNPWIAQACAAIAKAEGRP